MENDLESILSNFEENIDLVEKSGKARSYRLAIEYALDFLKISTYSKEMISDLNRFVEVLDTDNKIREQLRIFLKNRGQLSYLEKGWIKSATRSFEIFISKRY